MAAIVLACQPSIALFLKCIQDVRCHTDGSTPNAEDDKMVAKLFTCSYCVRLFPSRKHISNRGKVAIETDEGDGGKRRCSNRQR